ncbi:MAG: Lon protease family protein [Gemmatimonadota bacterium]
MIPALSTEKLRRKADLSAIGFESTAELAPIDGLLGQSRAADALQMGTRIDAPGFNLFVIGSTGASIDRAVKDLLREKAAAQPVPADWVYVNNFGDPRTPRAIELPPGRGVELRAAMKDLIDDLGVALPAAFESQDYQARRGAIDEKFQHRQEEALSALRQEGAARGVALARTPFGFALAPMKDGAVMKPEAINALAEDERNALQNVMAEFEKKLEALLQTIPRWDKERRDEVRLLDRETARYAVGHAIDELKARFADLPRVLEHLEALHADLLANVGVFIVQAARREAGDESEALFTGALERYTINVLVSQPKDARGAPVVEELHPTIGNLLGRVEHESQQGVLITNFRHIKAGALHRANGGYLMLDAHAVLSEYYSWVALKRVLKSGRIRIESLGDLLSLTSTVSLEPEPIPLNIKVVLYGDRWLYYLLHFYDPELSRHFKVVADFEDELARSPEDEAMFARLVAALAAREKLKPLDRAAVARVIEEAARLAEDAHKLTLLTDAVRDLLTEADFLSSQEQRALTTAADVDRAARERVRRAARLSERVQESIQRDIALIDTAGSRVGQINGLSVFELGGFMFGRPTRLTARVRPGSGRVVDIEREVKLGGPIHSKGVLILSGFISGRYALDVPMSIAASIVFEQSYGGVEGDSASCAELASLLSALADAPLRQDLAITGSVNQHGQVQAIGGVNAKIEGFFDICNARGLTGTQGVLIPASNVQHLMLRADVIDACAAGRFAIYAVNDIDEAIALLTGLAAGSRDGDGKFAADSVNGRVEAQLRVFARVQQQARAAEGRQEPV